MFVKAASAAAKASSFVLSNIDRTTKDKLADWLKRRAKLEAAICDLKMGMKVIRLMNESTGQFFELLEISGS